MTTVAECLKHSQECMKLAEAEVEPLKTALLQLAESWDRMADRAIVTPEPQQGYRGRQQ